MVLDGELVADASRAGDFSPGWVTVPALAVYMP
jgi:hypothetical protein